VSFVTGDAEQLPLESGRFSAVICECSFCTFPDQAAAAKEFFRVLQPAGRIGISDLNLQIRLPPALDSVLGAIICVAGARPSEHYAALLSNAGFEIESVEPHDEALERLIADVRHKLVGASILTKTQQIVIPDVDIGEALTMARWAANAVENGDLGYSMLVARR
jgi:arsenite methyltransferase